MISALPFLTHRIYVVTIMVVTIMAMTIMAMAANPVVAVAQA